MAVLDDIKVIKNITDTSKDGLLNIYIRRATTVIQLYLNVPTVTQLDKYRRQIIRQVTEIFSDTPVTTSTDDGTTTTTVSAAILDTYPDAVIQFVLEILNRQGDEGISKSTVGRQMQSEYELGISETVKTLLPVPYATTINTYELNDCYGNGNYDGYDYH